MAKRTSSSSNRKLSDRLQPDLKDGNVEAIIVENHAHAASATLPFALRAASSARST